MKNGKIASIIVIYYLLMIVYEILYPEIPSISKPWYFVFVYCFYYFLNYGLLFAVAYGFYKKTIYKCDALALFTLTWYSAGKFIYYIFLINKDFPTYISSLNSKFASIVISFALWSFAILIWTKKYKVNKLLKL